MPLSEEQREHIRLLSDEAIVKATPKDKPEPKVKPVAKGMLGKTARTLRGRKRKIDDLVRQAGG